MKKIYADFLEKEKKILRRKYKDIALAAGGQSAKYVSYIVNGQRPIKSMLSKQIHQVCRDLLNLLKPREDR
ncbi:MAG: hypothetical protein ABI045_03090 [Flavobacteriales bacterium]